MSKVIISGLRTEEAVTNLVADLAGAGFSVTAKDKSKGMPFCGGDWEVAAIGNTSTIMGMAKRHGALYAVLSYKEMKKFFYPPKFRYNLELWPGCSAKGDKV